MDVIYELNIDRRKQADIINQQNKEIVSLTHKLSIYTNTNSSSGQDLKGYADTKEFLAKAGTYKAAKEGDCFAF